MIDRRPGGTATIKLSGSGVSGGREFVNAPAPLDLL